MSEEKRPAWVKWVVLGCVGLIVVGLCAAAGIVALVMGSLKQSDAYKEALDKVRGDGAAVEALGEPIEPGFFLSGTVNVSGPSGDAVLSIPLQGPKGKGTLYLEATKSAGRWTYSLLELAVEGVDERVDLLAEE
jgi:hypothetical protein